MGCKPYDKNESAPKCFTNAQWAEWLSAASAECGRGLGNYCTDCTPQYQSEMIRVNRCAQPQVVFVPALDGFTAEERARSRAAWKGIAVEGRLTGDFDVRDNRLPQAA